MGDKHVYSPGRVNIERARRRSPAPPPAATHLDRRAKRPKGEQELVQELRVRVPVVGQPLDQFQQRGRLHHAPRHPQGPVQ